MLQQDYPHGTESESAEKTENAPANACSAPIVTETNPNDDGLLMHSSFLQSAQLPNLEMLKVLPHQLTHLEMDQQRNIIALVADFFMSFPLGPRCLAMILT